MGVRIKTMPLEKNSSREPQEFSFVSEEFKDNPEVGPGLKFTLQHPAGLCLEVSSVGQTPDCTVSNELELNYKMVLICR